MSRLLSYISSMTRTACKNDQEVFYTSGFNKNLDKIIDDHKYCDVNKHYVVIKKHAISLVYIF